jgi:ComF family protein
MGEITLTHGIDLTLFPSDLTHSIPMFNPLRSLFSLFVSQGCYACERPLSSQETYVCLHCLSQMEETHFHEEMTNNELYYRLAGRVPLVGAASLFYFDKAGKLQKLIQALKYERAPQLGTFLGRYFGEVLAGSTLMADVEALIPVPLHRSKLRQRGYNQAALIAEGMGEALGIPLREDLVQRTRKTSAQARKAGAARWANVEGAFVVQGELPAQVMVIDDVITTGATLEATVQALLAASQPPQGIRVGAIGLTRKH